MRKIIAAAAIAIALAAPGSAMAFPHGPHGWGGGWGHGWHQGWGWGAVGLGIGAIAIGEASCYREQPIYSPYGEYMGTRTVNVCY